MNSNQLRMENEVLSNKSNMCCWLIIILHHYIFICAPYPLTAPPSYKTLMYTLTMWVKYLCSRSMHHFLTTLYFPIFKKHISESDYWCLKTLTWHIEADLWELFTYHDGTKMRSDVALKFRFIWCWSWWFWIEKLEMHNI